MKTTYNMTPCQLQEGYYKAYRDTCQFTGIFERISGKFSLINLFANFGFREIAHTL